MSRWSSLQQSEIASLFILRAMFLAFATVLALIRSGIRGRVPLHTVKIDAMGRARPDQNNASDAARLAGPEEIECAAILARGAVSA